MKSPDTYYLFCYHIEDIRAIQEDEIFAHLVVVLAGGQTWTAPVTTESSKRGNVSDFGYNYYWRRLWRFAGLIKGINRLLM